MDRAARDWIAAAAGAATVREVRSLTFGIVSDLRLVDADGRLMVLRRHMNVALVRQYPNLVRDEVSALASAALVLGDLVPGVVASDPQGEAVGYPALLMTYLPGSAIIHGTDPVAMAQPLATLHSSPVPPDLPHFHRWYEDDIIGVPDWTNDERAWATLVDLMAEAPPASRHSFLHRDFHPGNLLWAEGELVGIVDWGFACQGPTAADVAHIRANLALVDGVVAADGMLEAYQALMPGQPHHPWWDASELFTWDSEFAGVMAFNAFGSQFEVEMLRQRADAFARSVAAWAARI